MSPFGWPKRKASRACCREQGAQRPLSECHAGEKGVVLSNADHRTTELGFRHGAELEVVRNDEGDDGLVAIVGDSRFVIPRESAAHIVICLGGHGHRHRGGRGRGRCSKR